MSPEALKIKTGDRVRVINKNFIQDTGYGKPRVAYDNNLQDVVGELKTKYKVQIQDFINQIDKLEFPAALRVGDVSDKDQYRGVTTGKICSALAFRVVHKRMQSGSERKIFYSQEEYWWDLPYEQVEKVLIKKTGKYTPPSGGYNYWGEWDYEPGYLVGIKTHRILKLSSGFWIEDKDVEKINN